MSLVDLLIKAVQGLLFDEHNQPLQTPLFPEVPLIPIKKNVRRKKDGKVYQQTFYVKPQSAEPPPQQPQAQPSVPPTPKPPAQATPKPPAAPEPAPPPPKPAVIAQPGPPADLDKFLAEHLPAKPKPAKEGILEVQPSWLSTKFYVTLKRLGILDEILQGETYHVRIPKPPYQPLVIERHDQPDGSKRIYMSRYFEEGGDRILDSEVVFELRDGELELLETATHAPGREIRGKDKNVALQFIRALREQGMEDVPREQWQGLSAKTQQAPAPSPDGIEGQHDTAHRVGEIRTVNGRTYRLNDNHRWERYDQNDGLLERRIADAEEKLELHLRKVGDKYVVEGRDAEADETVFMRKHPNEASARQHFEREAADVQAQRPDLVPAEAPTQAAESPPEAVAAPTPTQTPEQAQEAHPQAEQEPETGFQQAVQQLRQALGKPNPSAYLEAAADGILRHARETNTPLATVAREAAQIAGYSGAAAGPLAQSLYKLARHRQALADLQAQPEEAVNPPQPEAPPEEPESTAQAQAQSTADQVRERLQAARVALYASEDPKPHLLEAAEAIIALAKEQGTNPKRLIAQMLFAADIKGVTAPIFEDVLSHAIEAAMILKSGSKSKTMIGIAADVILGSTQEPQAVANMVEQVAEIAAEQSGENPLILEDKLREAVEEQLHEALPEPGPEEPPAVEGAPERPILDYSKPVSEVIEQLPGFGFELLPKSTVAQRRRANDQALALAEQLAKEGRPPTPEERHTLAKYTGEGGVSGDLNAHYTPTALAAAMWKLLVDAGFEGGDVLEPSMGAGVFFETAPQSAKMTGVELSPATSKVASLLHPDHEVFGSQPFERFHKDNPDRKFAAVIANPPYGERGAAWLEQDKPEMRTAENYFLDTALDHLHDGGVAAFLINAAPFEKMTGDAMDFKARLLSRAHIMGIYQLPSAVFKDSNSGVAPIIVLMKKREHNTGLALYELYKEHGEKALKEAGVWDESIMDGTYHLRPENTLGEYTGQAGFKGYKKFSGSIDAESLERLTKMPRRVEMPVTAESLRRLAGTLGQDSVDRALFKAAQYGKIEDGQISNDGQRIYTEGRWVPIGQSDPALAEALELSKHLQTMASVRNNGNRADAEMMRQQAVERLQRFIQKHGNPHTLDSLKDQLKNQHALANLIAAVDKDGNLASHITTPIHDHDNHADLVDRDDPHHVAQYLAGKSQLTIENLARLSTTHNTLEAARDFLAKSPEYALTEDGRFQHEASYYHGNIYDRADALRAMAEKEPVLWKREKYLAQAEKFLSLKPPKTLEDIDLSPVFRWIPTEAIAEYLEQELDESGRKWKVENRDGVIYIEPQEDSRYVPPLIEKFKQYINHALQPAPVRDADTKEEREAQRQKNIEEAKKLIEHFKTTFSNWAASSDYRETLEHEYNRRFNADVEPNEDASPLPVESDPTWVGYKPHPFQRQSVRFAMRNNGGIIALDVGLGKTLTGIALVSELQRTGQARKPLIVPPKSLLANWRKDMKDIHGEHVQFVSSPTESREDGKKHVLVIGQTYRGIDKKTGKEIWTDDTGLEVAQKLVRLANEDWHTALITREWHSRIPLTPENWMRMVESDAPMQRAIALQESDDQAFKGHGRRKKGSARDRQEQIARAMKDAVEKLFKDQNKPLHFEDLGVDHLIVDEAHSNKNLYAAPSVFGEQPKLMGAGAESKRAQDMYYKARLLREKAGGVTFLTATPTKNSPLEIFNMLSHTSEAFQKRGVGLPEEFIERYCHIEPRLFPQLDGSLETRPAVVGFKNLGELRGILGQYMFRRTATDPDVTAIPGWHVPKREDFEHTFDMHPKVQAVYDELAEKARNAMSSFGGVDQSGTHVFSYLSMLRKLTLDPTLYSEQFANLPNPRFKKAAELTKRAMDEGGKAILFMDMGKQRGGGAGDEDDPYEDMSLEDLQDIAVEYGLKPQSNRTALIKAIEAYEAATESNAYERLVQHLVDEGVPRDQIVVMTGETAKSAQKRQEVSQRFNAGEIKVVIGSTPIMGEGMNLQKGTTDMIHLDIPWEPGTYHQRLGRAQRQGNKLPSVRNHVLLAGKSFDAYTYSTMVGKKSWQDKLFRSHEDAADNDIGNSMEDIAIMLSKDPEAQRKAMADRRATIEAAAQAAKKQQALDRLLAAQKKTLAKTAAEREIAKLTSDIERAEKISSLPPTLQETLSQWKAKVIKLKARADKLGSEVKSMLKTMRTDPDIPAHHLDLLESGKPFVIDPNGNSYHPGSVFQAEGKPENIRNPFYRVIAVDPVGGTVRVRRVGGNKDLDIKTEDLAKTFNHGLEVPPEEMKRHILEHVESYIRYGNLNVLHQISPKYGGLAQDELEQMILGGTTYLKGAWIVKPTGEVAYKPNRVGSDSFLAEGERLLLPTLEHRKLLDGMDVARAIENARERYGWHAIHNFPFATKPEYTGRSTLYHLFSPEDEESLEYLIKAAVQRYADSLLGIQYNRLPDWNPPRKRVLN